MSLGISSLSRPIKGITNGHLDCSICGLVALAAKDSVFVYVATKDDIAYLRTIEVPGGRIIWLRWHPTDPVLAIAGEFGVVFWDARIGTPTHRFSLGGISAIEWKDSFLVIFRKRNALHLFDYAGCNMVWALSLDCDCATLSVDPFSSFRVVLVTSTGHSFVVVQSCSPEQIPKAPFEERAISGDVELINAFFHAHISDVLLLVCPPRVISFVFDTQTLKVILSDDRRAALIKNIVTDSSGVDYLHVLYASACIDVFEWSDNMNYSRVSSMGFSREYEGDCAVTTLRTYAGYYVFYSPVNGLSLVRSKAGVARVMRVATFTPISYTCFDSVDGVIAVGTEFGEIVVIDIEKIAIVHKYSGLNGPIIDVGCESSSVIHFIGDKASGTLDLTSRTITRYDGRSGFAKTLSVSDRVAVLIHSSHALGVVLDGREFPIITNVPIQSVAPQYGQSVATCFRGDNPNVAVLNADRTIAIYSCRFSRPVVTISLPRDLANPVAIAWRQDRLIIVDASGLIIVHDFDFGTMQRISGPSGVTEVEFIDDGFLLLTKDGILIISNGGKMSQFPLTVSGFRVCGHGLLLVETGSSRLQLLTTDWKVPQTSGRVLPRGEKRLEHVSSCVLLMKEKIPNKIASVFARAGFQFEAKLWRIVGRFRGGKKLSMDMSLYGRAEEMKERVEFVHGLIGHESSVKASLYCASLKILAGDLDGAAGIFLGMDTDDDQYIMAAVAGSFLGGNVSASAQEKMKVAAISMFNRNPASTCAHVLLLICGMELTAVQYLQEGGQWNRSLEVLKFMELSDVTKLYLRKCANYFLNDGKLEEAVFLFASIGDFHPVLCILVMMKRSCLALHLMMYLDSAELLHEFREGGQKQEEFYDLDIVREQIMQLSEPFTRHANQ